MHEGISEEAMVMVQLVRVWYFHYTILDQMDIYPDYVDVQSCSTTVLFNNIEIGFYVFHFVDPF